jgi:hypothetical protein
MTTPTLIDPDTKRQVVDLNNKIILLLEEESSEDFLAEIKPIDPSILPSRVSSFDSPHLIITSPFFLI